MSDDPRQLLDEKAMRALLSPSPADPEHAVHASMARLEREFIRGGGDPSAPSHDGARTAPTRPAA